jgi:uncharacterized protein YigA (DUF484 family)
MPEDVDYTRVVDDIVSKASDLRTLVNTLYDSWQHRYAARTAIITLLTNRNVTPEELRDALRQLL